METTAARLAPPAAPQPHLNQRAATGAGVFPNRCIGVEFEASKGNQGKRAPHLHLFISLINDGAVV